ncbi:hypothetical protein A3F37_03055 [Candidatus Saccharibacteria bacterium RIFCSPHIGHO2_12_FULL_41_12]|nr:MAG: hypothetical protein A3F37_03055 [Candidatus Saccharibacteria bacterium RIFCSPHIGHO2_12_FULL_41_12]
MKIVDLSVVLNEGTPVYPGDPATKIEVAGVFDKDGYNDHYVSVGTHVGTHIDAPLHMIADGKTIDKYPLDKFVGRGVYIKVENKIFDLEKLKNTDIREGDIVLFHTGMSDLYGQSEYFDNSPEIPEEIAQYLLEKKISMVGMDMCSPDQPPFSTHKILLSGDVLIIENLTNLAQLENKQFTVQALPLKLDIEASPSRVIAKLV